MNISATIENTCEGEEVPDPSMMRRWLSAALTHYPNNDVELSIRIVDEIESQALNLRYRQCEAPTNVLSFPADLPAYVQLPLLGDLVICAPVVAREAREQRKTLNAHWAHMVVHGVLHLLGYNHIQDSEATIMEALETDILRNLNYPAPYTPATAGSV